MGEASVGFGRNGRVPVKKSPKQSPQNSLRKSPRNSIRKSPRNSRRRKPNIDLEAQEPIEVPDESGCSLTLVTVIVVLVMAIVFTALLYFEVFEIAALQGDPTERRRLAIGVGAL